MVRRVVPVGWTLAHVRIALGWTARVPQHPIHARKYPAIPREIDAALESLSLLSSGILLTLLIAPEIALHRPFPGSFARIPRVRESRDRSPIGARPEYGEVRKRSYRVKRGDVARRDPDGKVA